MHCKITRNAAKKIREMLEQESDKTKKLRVVVTHQHGDHVHYGLALDVPGEHDETVMTDKEIEVLLDKREPWLDGVKVDYLFFPNEEYVITNPAKGNHADH